MPFDLTITQSGGTSLNLTLDAGQILFVLGANGNGKSCLMHRFFTAHQNNARRITAHRQTWFESNAVTLTGEARRSTENSMRNTDMSPAARWMDQYAST